VTDKMKMLSTLKVPILGLFKTSVDVLITYRLSPILRASQHLFGKGCHRVAI
jgi:hypothetical protein